jgi:hypothetical protein
MLERKEREVAKEMRSIPTAQRDSGNCTSRHNPIDRYRRCYPHKFGMRRLITGWPSTRKTCRALIRVAMGLALSENRRAGNPLSTEDHPAARKMD